MSSVAISNSLLPCINYYITNTTKLMTAVELAIAGDTCKCCSLVNYVSFYTRFS